MPQLRVLVVEDDNVQRMTLCSWLAGISGLSVTGGAASGSEALAELEKARPDLVLTDVEMPGIDGFDLTRHIRKMVNAPRVVIMSASDEPSYNELAQLAGAETFIHKPGLYERLAHFLRIEFGLDAKPLTRGTPAT